MQCLQSPRCKRCCTLLSACLGLITPPRQPDFTRRQNPALERSKRTTEQTAHHAQLGLRAHAGGNELWDGRQPLAKVKPATEHRMQVQEVRLQHFQAKHAHPQREGNRWQSCHKNRFSPSRLPKPSVKSVNVCVHAMMQLPLRRSPELQCYPRDPTTPSTLCSLPSRSGARVNHCEPLWSVNCAWSRNSIQLLFFSA